MKNKRKIYAKSPIGLVEASDGIAETIRNESDEELLKKYGIKWFHRPF